MKREVTLTHFDCDYCGADLGPDGSYVIDPICQECGKHTCDDHGVRVLYRGSMRMGLHICREHIKAELPQVR